MADLTFLTDSQLRAMVERDKEEMDRCLEAGLCKSTMLLGGSIVEAILTDFLLEYPLADLDDDRLQSADLAHLVDWAEEAGGISARSRELATVIRNYRNLIHPGRERRLGERVDTRTARVASELVEMIIDEMAHAYAQKRGRTAEQVLAKITDDDSSEILLSSLLHSMSRAEREKLFYAIPECAEDSSLGLDAFDVARLVRVHQVMKDVVGIEVLTQSVEGLYDLICSCPEWRGPVRGLRYFVGDLHLLGQERETEALRYLLDVIAVAEDEALPYFYTVPVARELGARLNTSGRVGILRQCIMKRFTDVEMSGESLERFTDTVEQLLAGMPGAVAIPLVTELQEIDWPDGLAEWAGGLEVIPF